MIFVAAMLGSFAAGVSFEGHYGDPVVIKLKTVGVNDGFAEQGFYVFGGPQKPGNPPRCRAVPEGQGCVDWFEPGEDDWDRVLSHRPSQPKPVAALWEKGVAALESGRYKK